MLYMGSAHVCLLLLSFLIDYGCVIQEICKKKKKKKYKALPWLRACTFGLGAQSANIWIRDWNVRNAIIEVLVLRNPRTCPTPPALGVGRGILKMAVMTSQF